MKEHFTKEDITSQLIEAVNAYLVLRAQAEVLKTEVDMVAAQLLQEMTLMSVARPRHQIPSKRITDPSLTYKCQDQMVIQEYYTVLDKRLKESGIKPSDMERDYCPALVAKHDQVKAEWVLFDEAAKMLELDYDGAELNNRCNDGRGTRQKYIDLLVGLVVNL